MLQRCAMSAENAELLELLDLQSADKGIFIGPPARDPRSRVFGGHVLAQALAAACFTVDGRPCHSFHAYFVRPGKPGRPIEYEVAAMRDGQSFAMRKVVAVQRDEINLELIASFDRGSPGAEHRAAMPDTPPPESFPNEDATHRADAGTRAARAARDAALQAPDRVDSRRRAQLSRPHAFARAGAHVDAGARAVDGRSEPAPLRAGLCVGHGRARAEHARGRRAARRQRDAGREPRPRGLVSPTVPFR